MAQITAECIRHSYGDNQVLIDVSFSIEKGDFVSVLGASGSGKTTLLSILSGLERPTSGKVFIDGENIAEKKERELAILRRTKISFVYQFFNLAPYLNVEQNILVPVFLNRKPQKQYAERLTALLNYMGIADKRKDLPSALSGGEQQRVAIARGLIFEPEILFLDEPTGNLDSRNSADIMQLLQNVNHDFGTTVIQVTHSEANAAYGNRILHIIDGRITGE